MNLRSLIPSGNGGTRTNPSANPFGFLHREIDRLFEDFTRGLDAGGQAQVNLVPSIDVTRDRQGDRDHGGNAGARTQRRRDFGRGRRADHPRREEGRKRAGRQEQELPSHERSYGVFYRVLQLPPGVDPSKIQATMSNGVLKITIPKPARSEAKKIEVKEAA